MIIKTDLASVLCIDENSHNATAAWPMLFRSLVSSHKGKLAPSSCRTCSRTKNSKWKYYFTGSAQRFHVLGRCCMGL